MRNERNRPVIEPGDYPATIEAALELARIQTIEGETDEQVWHRKKTLEEARDSVRDRFVTLNNGEMLRPDGEVILFMTFDGLGKALELYRSSLSGNNPPSTEEIYRVDELALKVRALE